MAFTVGLDIGASLAKGVLLDQDSRLCGRAVLDSRSPGPFTVQALLTSLLRGRKAAIVRLGVTGVGRQWLRFPPGTRLLNEIIALAQGAAAQSVPARSVIEVGAQTSSWLRLDAEGRGEEHEILDFALNEKCAAGAGAFLEQQAGRLRLGLDEFATLAAGARRKAKVAGRCSVFAKSDMIHLQQKGTPVEEIAYGLCLALARNFVATALKGKDCPPPVLLAGGGALNRGLVRAFQEILGLGPGQIGPAPEALYTCALGAARTAARDSGTIDARGLEEWVGELQPASPPSSGHLPVLGRLASVRGREPALPSEGEVDGFLGVDVGSVSTDLAVIDLRGELLAGSYVATAGRPLQALAEAYAELLKGFRGRLRIRGVGTTGSGRYLAGKILDSDIIHNEITCQMRSTLHYFPEADTVFEIGGQDSKFISLRDGRIQDFTMNKVCAAGTGSFLEEQAALLKIDIERDFSRLAERSTAPHDLGSRCTVFMETELVDAVSRGVPVPDVAAGLAYSVARNYLEKVVAPRPVGQRVVFQGGVASNSAVVAAFCRILGRPVEVHPHNRVSGAIGAALLARESSARSAGAVRTARDLDRMFRRDYEVSSFECRQCSNRCSVNRITFEGGEAYFGDTCERYTSRDLSSAGRSRGPGGSQSPPPDLIREREEGWARLIRRPDSPRAEVGLPRISYILDYLPFWAGFFAGLGCGLTVSPATDMELFERGLKKLPAEVCLPAKVAFGHAFWLHDRGLANIFLPSILSFEPDEDGPSYPCPYGEHLPFMLRSSLGFEIIAPDLDLKEGRKGLVRGLRDLPKVLGCGPRDLNAALDLGLSVQREFQAELSRRGAEALDWARREGRLVFALLGRPYNIFDAFLNLNLARHLAKLGVVAIPGDSLPLGEGRTGSAEEIPVWKYNRQAIRAARWCLDQDDVFPVILTNFGCGPDAFGLKHLSRILTDKPYLVLEFDEHQAEAGLITRLEAFRDEALTAHGRVRKPLRPRPQRVRGAADTELIEEFRRQKIYVPYFADHAHAFSGAMRAVGLDAELLPRPDRATIALGEEHSSGKECHAYAYLTGDLVKLVQSRRADGSIFFFPGTERYCLLQQYGPAMNFLLGELGQGRLRVVSPKFDFTARLLGMDGLKWLWRGLVAVDLLVKEACRLRAYETQAGLTDRLHWDNLKDLEAGLTRRDLDPSLSRMAARLRSVEVRDERRPLVGVAGDIYTRTNGFANHDLFHRLEAMGCEVWPAPFFVDEAEFTTQESLVRAWRGVRIPELAAAAVLNLRKDLERARVRRVLDWGEDRWAEPGYRDVLSKSAPYLSQHSNPLVLLNVAKMVDFARRGADGVLNVICFNCMLGTVSGALAERIRRDCGNIPLPTLVYSGTDSVSEQTRLEAFVYQAKRFAERRGSRTAPEQARPSSGGAGPGRLWVARGRGAPGSREGD